MAREPSTPQSERELYWTATLRSPTTLTHVPLLARPLLWGTRHKLRGLPRILRKLYISFYRLLFVVLRLPIYGQITVSGLKGDVPIRVGLANPQFLLLPRPGEQHPYEPAVAAFLDRVVPRLSVVFDIGSNWGHYVSFLLSDPRFEGKIHTFEISPSTFQDLSGVVRALDTENRVTCHQTGLSDAPGTVRVKRTLFSGMTQIVESEKRGVPMQVVTLDSLKLPDPDLIKIDVEGHEANVLRGALGVLKRARPIVVFENWFAPNLAPTMEPLQVLVGEGYVLYQMAWRLSIHGNKVYSLTLPPETTGEAPFSLLPMPVAMRPLTLTGQDLVAIHPSRLDAFFPPEAHDKP